mmetsp:Transcript_15933/g.39667  ORF Transcript_15933/g.39667 Transcript_15933/m.39667 type:complete len:562 (-) Transcript_15933:395-2080(-)
MEGPGLDPAPAAPHLPPELLHLVLPRVQLAKGHVPQRVCRVWRDALADLDMMETWILQAHAAGDVQKAFRYAASCSHHGRGAVLVHHMLAKNTPPLGPEPPRTMPEHCYMRREQWFATCRIRREARDRRWGALKAGCLGAAAGGNTQLCLELQQVLINEMAAEAHGFWYAEIDLHHRKAGLLEEAFCAAAAWGQTLTMQWLVAQNGLPQEHTFTIAYSKAAESEQFAAMQLIRDWAPQWAHSMDSFALRNAADTKNVPAVLWLLEHGATNEYAAIAAIRGKAWSIAMLLLPQLPRPAAQMALKHAIRGEQLLLCQALIDQFSVTVTTWHINLALKQPGASEADYERAGTLLHTLIQAAATNPQTVADAGFDEDIDRLQALLNAGGKPQGNKLNNAVDLDLGWGDEDDVKRCRPDRERICLMLLRAGAKPEMDDLVEAAAYGMEEACRHMVATGALNMKRAGRAMVQAAENGYPGICQLLVQAGCDPGCLRQPLMEAITRHDMAAFNTLMASGVVPVLVKEKALAHISELCSTLGSMEASLYRRDAGGQPGVKRQRTLRGSQ